MWRSVYQKAAEAAEGRMRALLAAHQYHLHGQRAVAVVLDGGGTPLVPFTERADLELPWGYALEGWALYADGPGDLVLDLRASEDFAAYPTFATICPVNPPTLVAQDKARSANLTGWTTRLPRGTVLRVLVMDAGTVTLATLTLFLRAL
jgi:hypothetical protein